MPTLAESLVNSAARPIRLRLRPDLTTRRHRYHGQAYWVVKEPVGLNYYRFHEEEYAILQMLDGHASLESIKDQFEREFAPQKITFPDLQHFIGMLHRSGLVISESAGQGWQLKKRRDEKKRKELLGKFTNVFALRFRGIDPERILNRLHPYAAWLFRPPAVLFFTLVGISALLLLLIQFDVFRRRLPTFHEFFGPANWIYLGVTMAVVKVLHEFGHGLTCKHFGGECHEMGFMFLVFTPALYCNVSDSWMLPNKWHRVFIGAAGMYVEFILAATATFVWWFSQPGLLNHLALSVMFICSVSTLLFNGNPLLRFDGYYILMDILEIPNLRQKSTEVLRRFLVQHCLGIEQQESPFLPQRNQFLFAMYTVAAVLYRWVVVFSILWFLNEVLAPYGLRVLGLMLGMVGVFGLVVQPLYQMGKFFYMPGRMHQVKLWRLGVSASIVAAIAGFILLVPLPYRVECDFTLEPRDAKPVYPPRQGRLEKVHVQADQRIAAGQPIAEMRNEELELRWRRLSGQQKLYQQRLESSEFHPGLSDNTVDRKMLEAVERELAKLEDELERLRNITAPIDGIVLPVAIRPLRSAESMLPSWSGSLLYPRNLYATIQPTDAICQVGDPTQLEAVLIVDEAETQFIGINNKVELLLDSYTDDRVTTQIHSISDKPLIMAPPALATQAGGRLETYTDGDGMSKPISTCYPARAPVEDPQRRFVLGMRGRARIHAAPRTLGDRLYRYIAETFRFKMS